MAGIDHRAVEDHRSAHDSHREWRDRRRRFRCRDSVAAGYGFSGKPTTLGWDPIRIARAWAVLMERLGYKRYVAQGGDWGNAVTEQLALLQPAGLIGIHT